MVRQCNTPATSGTSGSVTVASGSGHWNLAMHRRLGSLWSLLLCSCVRPRHHCLFHGQGRWPATFRLDRCDEKPPIGGHTYELQGCRWSERCRHMYFPSGSEVAPAEPKNNATRCRPPQSVAAERQHYWRRRLCRTRVESQAVAPSGLAASVVLPEPNMLHSKKLLRGHWPSHRCPLVATTAWAFRKMASGGAGPARRPKWPILAQKWPPGAPGRPGGHNGRCWLKTGLRARRAGQEAKMADLGLNWPPGPPVTAEPHARTNQPVTQKLGRNLAPISGPPGGPKTPTAKGEPRQKFRLPAN